MTYTDTVSVPSPGAGIPTGSVDFDDGGSPISGCQNVTLSDTSPDTAQCMTVPGAGGHAITAVYSGDDNYATSTGHTSQQISPVALTVTANNQSRLFGQANPALTYKITGFVNGDGVGVVSGAAVCTTTATQASVGGSYPIACTQGTLSAANYTFAPFVAGTLTVTYSRTVTGLLAGLPVTVPAGQSWQLGHGATILGAVDLGAGSSVDIEPGAIVAGAISANGAATVRICGAGLLAAVGLSGDSGPVLIGDGTSGCPLSTITGALTVKNDASTVTIERALLLGPLSVSGGAGAVTVTDNTVTGPLTVTDNSGGATVTGNTVVGTLTVTANKGTVVDKPNTVFGSQHVQ